MAMYLLLYPLVLTSPLSNKILCLARAAVFVGLIAAVYSVATLVPKVSESFQQLYDQVR
jgi:hypothetical protein